MAEILVKQLAIVGPFMHIETLVQSYNIIAMHQPTHIPALLLNIHRLLPFPPAQSLKHNFRTKDLPLILTDLTARPTQSLLSPSLSQTQLKEITDGL